ncbi:DUF3667 domain-containing protein [Rubrivirga sp. IMCC43871]|uniref:DUF3667 domain-containing protein n=1 Tax=Rubrivirga sp. IMCC43871 TaxID=3391575 RepID=UPI0039900B5C
MDLAPAPTCATCGAALHGPFCARCGQQVRPGRLTMASVVREAVQHVSSLDSGLARTAVDLVRRPAGLIRDVFAGRTVRYAGPVRYFLLAVTAAQLLAFFVGDVSEMAEAYAEGYEGNRPTQGGLDQAVVARRIEQFWVFAFAGVVPFVTLWSRLLLRRSGLTLAEHAVAHLYLLGQVALIAFGLSISLGEVVSGQIGYGLAALVLAAPFGLYLWASVGVFERGRVWSPVATALSLLLGFATYGTAGGVAYVSFIR